MPGVFENATGIARESVVQLEDNLAAMATFYRDFEPEFTSGVNRGDTIKIRRPPTFVTNEFDGVNPTIQQDVVEGSTSLTIEKHLDVTVKLTDKDLSLNLRDFTQQIAMPAMKSIAAKAEAYVLSKYTGISNAVGNAGIRFNNLSNLSLISAYLTQAQIPIGSRMGLIDPFVASDLRSTGDMLRADALGDGGRAMRDAYVGRKGGIDWMESEAVPQHTAGTISNGTVRGGKVKANTLAGANVFTLTDTSLNGTVVVGDIFTIPGVVNSRGILITHVVTGAATASANDIVVAFSPALNANVSINTVVTFAASHAVGIVGDRRGLAYVMIAPEAPLGGALPSASVNYRGLGIRVVFGYDMGLKKNVVAFDTMIGAKVIQPELLYRTMSNPAAQSLT